MTYLQFNRFSKEKSISDLFLEQVENQPYATAVVDKDDYITYLDLAEKSTNLALFMQQLGVSQGKCIGLYLESSIELIVGAWGILLSGNAYLPLSTEYPDTRLQFMIKNSNTRYILTEEKMKAELQTIISDEIEIICLEEIDSFCSDRNISKYELKNNNKPDNLAYVIYTSGSTGEPKGVMIEHRSIVNQMSWLKSTYSIDQSKTILQKTPISFDAAQWEILAVACGCKIVVGGSGIYRDPEKIIKVIKEQKVTTLQCVPTLLQALLHLDEFSTCTSLTHLFSGGEALSKKLASQFFATFSESELINLYGPTECTINASSYKVNRSTLSKQPNMIPIGFPVDNTQFYILNEDLKPVINNEVGELYIGGIQLARGYMNRPDMTSERFIDNPLNVEKKEYPKLYKTGDRAFWNDEGSVQFTGRADNQVKLRGYRVELDEIRIAIETHDWVKNAVVLVKEHPISETNRLLAFVELDAKEAAVMDQGNHGSHHQSKKNKLQLKAQLANLGCREKKESCSIINLPFKEATEEQRQFAFARKTYRFYEGGEVDKSKLLDLLQFKNKESESKQLENLKLNEFGRLLRYFGQFKSTNRLLPKYSYASPGALYATQMYFEINNVCGLSSGIYYYHPLEHQLVLVNKLETSSEPKISIHFLGKKRAIEPVYKNNIQEVLEMEVGHMIGVFENILPDFGLSIDEGRFNVEMKEQLDGFEEDYYLGTFEITPYMKTPFVNLTEVYVQSHNNSIVDLPKGLYIYKNDELEKISEEVILKKDVIAINQSVYERSSLGIALVSKAKKEWKKFIVLGRKLQHLQMNELNFGFMSSGYSSKTGNNLPAANRLNSILEKCNHRIEQSYFCVGGMLSEEQLKSEGMNEDVVHMKGPAEMLRDDLVNRLPHYMIPNNTIILDHMPQTPNGKIDVKAIEKLGAEHMNNMNREIILPRTRAEKRIAEIWTKAMKLEELSIKDDFFELGGNSLIAVSLLNKVNEAFQCKLPMQILFEYPTVEQLAKALIEKYNLSISRLIPLQSKGQGNIIFCWPGLGGYTMNLKPLAEKLGDSQPFYGIQALGLNEGEQAYDTISEMAKKDIEEIRAKQAKGPYSLWGFSFGARVAFETCYQLEQSGEEVNDLILIAPGSPKVWAENESDDCHKPEFSNPAFVIILFSVFAGNINDERLEECLTVAKDEDSFAQFICEKFDKLNIELVRRIISVVQLTYEFKYSFTELKERKIKAPILILKAKGDDYSFIENTNDFSANEPIVVQLEGDHYKILKEPFINELVDNINQVLDGEDRYISRIVENILMSSIID